jgi:hypothetical protein
MTMTIPQYGCIIHVTAYGNHPLPAAAGAAALGSLTG